MVLVLVVNEVARGPHWLLSSPKMTIEPTKLMRQPQGARRGDEEGQFVISY